MKQSQCKHFSKYKAINRPKCNCTACWRLYFSRNPGRYAASLVAVKKAGNDVLEAQEGKKYVKFFLWFRGTFGKAFEQAG